VEPLVFVLVPVLPESPDPLSWVPAPLLLLSWPSEEEPLLPSFSRLPERMGLAPLSAHTLLALLESFVNE